MGSSPTGPLNPLREISKLATGPPTRLAITRPRVAAATPISMAFDSPKRASISGAQAIVVPWPPIREADPNSTVIPFGSPSAAALPAAIRFWIRRKTKVSASRTRNGRPPLIRSSSRALRPMPVKK